MSPLAQIIAAEIRRSGPLPCARYMELALYHPEFGYYQRVAPQVGRAGDFFTSVSIGSLFGELLGFQFAQWQHDFVVGTFQLIEAGAHDGRLAGDILNYFRDYQPTLFEALEYWIIEPSPHRQTRPAAELAGFGHRVRFAESLEALPLNGIRGVIFSNELLDAFPVARLGWDAQTRDWFEWGVALANDKFAWQRIPTRAVDRKLLPALPEALLAVLPDGFTTEICPAASAWWQQAAARLQHGHLLTFDYGLSAEEFFAPERARGTLRSYRQHHFVDDMLADPGQQDITAHVNWTALGHAGESSGLKTVSLSPQSKFLTEIANQTWQPGARFPAWTKSRTRQFQSLVHPDHFGRAFQTLVQTR